MQGIIFNEKIQKIRSLIKQWKRRYLTPLGKITVIKSLLLPILNNLFISIPNPTDQILKELNNIFFEYLWEGPAKIKQSIAVRQHCQGGLQMINPKAFINSLKLTWLRRVIISTIPWQSVLKNIVNFQEIFTLGRENIISLIRNVKHKFWVDVLKVYADIHHLNHQDTENHVLSSPIFHNNEIKVSNKSVYIKSGIKMV